MYTKDFDFAAPVCSTLQSLLIQKVHYYTKIPSKDYWIFFEKLGIIKFLKIYDNSLKTVHKTSIITIRKNMLKSPYYTLRIYIF